jgi:hypothetical protein
VSVDARMTRLQARGNPQASGGIYPQIRCPTTPLPADSASPPLSLWRFIEGELALVIVRKKSIEYKVSGQNS